MGGGSGTAEGRHNARQRQGQGRFGDWGALSPGHPHTAGRETGRLLEGRFGRLALEAVPGALRSDWRWAAKGRDLRELFVRTAVFPWLAKDAALKPWPVS